MESLAASRFFIVSLSLPNRSSMASTSCARRFCWRSKISASSSRSFARISTRCCSDLVLRKSACSLAGLCGCFLLVLEELLRFLIGLIRMSIRRGVVGGAQIGIRRAAIGDSGAAWTVVRTTLPSVGAHLAFGNDRLEQEPSPAPVRSPLPALPWSNHRVDVRAFGSQYLLSLDSVLYSTPGSSGGVVVAFTGRRCLGPLALPQSIRIVPWAMFSPACTCSTCARR